MHGGAWYDDLWSGIKSVGSVVAPFAAEIAPLLLRRNGAVLVVYQWQDLDKHTTTCHQIIYATHTEHVPPRMIGHGSLGRTRRGLWLSINFH